MKKISFNPDDIVYQEYEFIENKDNEDNHIYWKELIKFNIKTNGTWIMYSSYEWEKSEYYHKKLRDEYDWDAIYEAYNKYLEVTKQCI